MTIERATVDKVWPLQTVHLMGQTARASAGAGVGEQTAEILARIDDLLKEAGTDRSELIRANFWLRNLEYFAEMNKIWDHWIVPGRTPHRTTFEDQNLPDMCDVKVDVVAWRKTGSLARA